MERQFRGYPAKNPTSGTSGSSKQNSVYTIERTEPSETPRMFTATISSYELDWDDLKAWLEEKIPGGELDKAEVSEISCQELRHQYETVC